MKNLIKLFALIALITANASNVCGQTYEKIALSGTYEFVLDNHYDVLTIDSKENIISGKIKVNGTVVDNGFDSSGVYRFDYQYKKDDTITIDITTGFGNILYNLSMRKYTVGLNNNLLANDVNLYSYNNTIVLENKVAPKKLNVNVYNLTGQLVLTESTEGLNTHNEFNTNLPNGIYVVHVSDGVNTMVKKIVFK